MNFSSTSCGMLGAPLPRESLDRDRHAHQFVEVVDGNRPQRLSFGVPCRFVPRALKKIRPLPASGFWTAKGSKRKLKDDDAVRDGVIYVVRKQPNPLATWYAPRWQAVIDSYDAGQQRKGG